RRLAGAEKGVGCVPRWRAGLRVRRLRRKLGQTLENEVVELVDLALEAVEVPGDGGMIDPGDVELEHADPSPDILDVRLDRRDVLSELGMTIRHERLPELDDGKDGARQGADADDE